MLCGCVGQSGGGWSHYVGQEKLRPQTGWTAARLCARLDPPAAADEFDVVLLCAHRSVALRDVDGRTRSSRRPRRTVTGTGASSTTTSAPSVWAGCRPRRSSRQNPLEIAKQREGGGHSRRRTTSPRRSRSGELEACLRRSRTIPPTGRATCSSGARTCWVRQARGMNISSSTCSAPPMA